MVQRAQQRNPSEVDRDILQAARQSIMAVGMRNSSIAEIARNAGVSRPTVYRRYTDIDALTTAVIHRETLSILGGLTSMPGNSRQRILARFKIAVSGIVASEFFQKIVESDPDRILHLVTQAKDPEQQLIVDDFILPGIVHGQEDGSIRSGDPRALANRVFRLMQGSALLFSGVEADGNNAEETMEIIVDVVDRYLRP